MEEQTPTQPKEPIKIENATHVIGWIESFLGIIKKYGISKIIIASLLLAIVCVFFYFIFNPTKAFEAYDNYKQTRHDELIELRTDNAPKVQSLIDKLTMKVDASRTLVLEMHNGNFGEGGLPFTRATATYEALNIGISPISAQYENTSLSLMPFASYLLKEGYFAAKEYNDAIRQVTGTLLDVDHNILIATKLRRYNPLTIVFYSGLIAAVPSVLYAALAGDLPGIGAVFAARPDALVLNVLLAVFCSVLPYGLYNTAVKTMAASKASILATFEPIAAALFGLVLFQETVTSAGWLGIVCEVAALVLLQLPEKQHAS